MHPIRFIRRVRRARQAYTIAKRSHDLYTVYRGGKILLRAGHDLLTPVHRRKPH